MGQTPEEEKAALEAHAFKDNTGRFPLDDLLRKKGFKIHMRSNKKGVYWEKSGILFPYKEALLFLDKKEAFNAEYAET